MTYYTSSHALNDYLLFHYGSAAQILPFPAGPQEALYFPKRLIAACADFLRPDQKVLDLGCAVGGAAFELARHCREVVGIDASDSFIHAATQLQKVGHHAVSILISGNDCIEDEVCVAPDIDRSRVRFKVGDAHRVTEKFDGVLMANLIDRLQNPRTCLQQMKEVVNLGGVMIITTPYTWVSDCTPEENWIQGHQGLNDILSANFELCQRSDLPFLLREHARKFQWSVADVTVWQRFKK